MTMILHFSIHVATNARSLIPWIHLVLFLLNCSVHGGTETAWYNPTMFATASAFLGNEILTVTP